jgi:alkaline phosphatase D
MKTRALLLIGFGLWFAFNASAQIASGPMLGYVDFREACVWVQTENQAEVILAYRESTSERVHYSAPVYTSIGEAFTAKLYAINLEPGKAYVYDLLINGVEMNLQSTTFTTQALWQYRVDPPAFTLATGSCSFINEVAYDRPGKGYGGDYHIFETIAGMSPDVMLWLGDNVYLREVDYRSRSGIFYRYSHTRALPEMQKLLRSCPNLAIWDDHDYGPNDADRSYIHKEWTKEAFELFWANPSFGLPGQGGITSQFAFSDVDFFLMDNRWFRSNYELNGTEKQIFGRAQIDWLIEALKFSKAPFKMIATGGQFISDLPVYENHAQYPEERAYLLKRLDEEGISGVIFLSGDRHHTEFSSLTLPGGKVVYDLTVSPLTSTAYDHSAEQNSHRVAGTDVDQRNFATLHFSGPRKNRQVEINVFDADGQLLWKQVVTP